jgi:hypothetical protein
MKTIILFTVLIFCSLSLKAQSESNLEESKFRFGFNLGANYSMIKPVNTPTANYEISNGIGFNLGVVMDYSVTDNFIISPKTELAFHNGSMEFRNNNGSKYTYEVLPISLNIMTHFKYKITGKKHIPYIFVGPNLKIPLSRNPTINTAYKTSYDIALDFGIGIENKVKNFIFAPELRYSYGLLNINGNPSLKGLKFHSISLVLNFT